ncbi:MAG: hypothetical protein JRF72_19085 [Deltaproteobacteria bacterium]|jgi:AraC-like DNA-binding protein|nr:hypothetical protein [Deltaproteobacteria bacterium]
MSYREIIDTVRRGLFEIAYHKAGSIGEACKLLQMSDRAFANMFRKTKNNGIRVVDATLKKARALPMP